MNKTKYIGLILAAVLLSGCGVVKNNFRKRPAETEERGREQRTRDIVLYPDHVSGSDRIQESGLEHITIVETDQSSFTVEDWSFSGLETEHVRVRGIHPMPDGGLTLDLDVVRREFHYPYDGKFISDYGPRGNSYHTGVDIKAIPNDTIRAAMPGVVRMSKNYSSYGNIVVIRHYCGLETVYSHGSKNLVKVNDIVGAGTPIQLAGRTGRATTEHLHFEIRISGEHFDPKLMIDPHNRELRSGMLYVRNVGGNIIASNSLGDLDARASQASQAAQTTAAARAAAVTESERISSSSGTTSTQNTEYYRVRSGDTLSAIARKHGTTVKKLCQLNGIKETSILQINQRLRVK